MKKIYFTILLLCLSTFSFAQATLTHNLPATIPAGEATEFTLTFNPNGTSYDDWDLEAQGVNTDLNSTFKLEYKNGSTWEVVSFYATTNAQIAQMLNYNQQTLQLRITPFQAGANSINFFARCWVGGGDPWITVAQTTVNYTAGGSVASVTTNPTSLNFGVVNIGSSKPLDILITPQNCTGNLSLSIDAGVQCTLSTYSISGTSPTTVTVTFTPVYNYQVTGKLTISGGGLPSAHQVDVQGTGLNIGDPKILINVSDLNFMQVSVGTYKEYKPLVTLENITEDVTLSTDNECFTVTPNTISSSQAVTEITVRFTPTNEEDYYGWLTITNPEVSSATRVSLIGEGYFNSISELEKNISICISGKNIVVNGIENAQFKVFDLQGKELISTNQNSFNFNAKAGIYFLSIKKDKLNITHNFFYW